MKRLIASTVTGWTNSALRLPYVYGVLDCGHSCEIPTRKPLATCMGCGVRDDNTGRRCACGTWHRSDIERVEYHDPAWWLLNVGDAVECVACDDYAAGLTHLAEVLPEIHHTRIDRYGSKYVHCYRLDPSSPSNFMLVMSIEDRPEAIAMLRGGLSPLSPTEAV